MFNLPPQTLVFARKYADEDVYIKIRVELLDVVLPVAVIRFSLCLFTLLKKSLQRMIFLIENRGEWNESAAK